MIPITAVFAFLVLGFAAGLYVGLTVVAYRSWAHGMEDLPMARCHVPRCRNKIPHTTSLFCPEDWARVPLPLQAKIVEAYVPGVEYATGKTKWRSLVSEALYLIDAAREKEGE